MGSVVVEHEMNLQTGIEGFVVLASRVAREESVAYGPAPESGFSHPRSRTMALSGGLR
jgi:hypothetical protein